MFVVDIIIAILLGYALYKGLQKGLVVAILSLFALIIGVYVSLKFSFYTRDILFIDSNLSEHTITLAAFFITFVIVLLVLFFLGKMLTKMISAIALGFLNRVGGAVFEGLKMVLIISIILNLFQKINFNHIIVSKEQLDSSLFYRPIEEVSKKVFPLMEKWYQDTLLNTINEIDKFESETKNKKSD